MDSYILKKVTTVFCHTAEGRGYNMSYQATIYSLGFVL